MKHLGPEEAFCLRSAQGWLELGNPAQAREELERLAPGFQRHPQVLELKWKACGLARQWSGCLRIAEAMVDCHPGQPSSYIYLSMSLHHLRRTEEAWETLFEVVDAFPQTPAIPYELARYSCSMRRWVEAYEWLEEALAAGDPAEIQQMAVKDPDLKPLWDRLDAIEAEIG